mmetsp:Transcript_33939/g.55363  ORF Transcript_33939/g.55363 Transcript_33939/m.55363 type:complete len:231 (-) Transcript_33939:84-776(-)
MVTNDTDALHRLKELVFGGTNGALVGLSLGSAVGKMVGSFVGISVGSLVVCVGSLLGALVLVGSLVGSVVGSVDGARVRVGSLVGSSVGEAVGPLVGSSVGSAVGEDVGSAVGALVGGRGHSMFEIGSLAEFSASTAYVEIGINSSRLDTKHETYCVCSPSPMPIITVRIPAAKTCAGNDETLALQISMGQAGGKHGFPSVIINKTCCLVTSRVLANCCNVELRRPPVFV